MKSIKIMFTVLLICLMGLSFAQTPDENFAGKWKTEEGQIVLISKTTTGFTGTSSDKKTIILKDIKNVDGKWKATIQNPLKKTSAPCELSLKNNSLEIVAKKGMMSKTLVWKKL